MLFAPSIVQDLLVFFLEHQGPLSGVFKTDGCPSDEWRL